MSPVMPTILCGLQENSTAGTTSFEVLISPPSPSGAQVEAFVDSSSAEHVVGLGPQNHSLASRHGVGR
jgi:hypothetical protein